MLGSYRKGCVVCVVGEQLLHSCPSGLRGCTQVALYSYSWVQIPPNAEKVLFPAKTIIFFLSRSHGFKSHGMQNNFSFCFVPKQKYLSLVICRYLPTYSQRGWGKKAYHIYLYYVHAYYLYSCSKKGIERTGPPSTKPYCPWLELPRSN
jgi:hypothetical protein